MRVSGGPAASEKQFNEGLSQSTEDWKAKRNELMMGWKARVSMSMENWEAHVSDKTVEQTVGQTWVQ